MVPVMNNLSHPEAFIVFNLKPSSTIYAAFTDLPSEFLLPFAVLFFIYSLILMASWKELRPGVRKLHFEF